MSTPKGSFLFVALPPEGQERTIVYRELESKVNNAGNPFGEIFKFPIPQFKIGTLDTLIVLSEDLAKFDGQFEGATNKIVDVLRSAYKGDEARVDFACRIADQPPESYVTNYQWNSMKYRVDKPIADVLEVLVKEVNTLDNDVKTKQAQYLQAQNSYLTLQKKQTGNLSQKSLSGIVKREHVVLESEYLETIFIAVPRNEEKSFNAKYETLTPNVVPRSSQKLAQDEEFSLFAVTLFRRDIQEFSHRCRELKWIPRDFKYSESQLSGETQEFNQASQVEEKLWNELVRIAKSAFADTFQAWIHLKALRVFVESVLRYGLPPEFVSAVIKPNRKSAKALRKQLDKAYGYLGGHTFMSKDKGASADEVAALQSVGAGDDYTPYTCPESPESADRSTPDRNINMSNKIVLALDLYGTILDPASMQAYLADLFPDSAATLTSQWRRYQLEYTWRTTCQETYEPFETITKKALRHALAECGEDATERNIFDIMCQYETLGMFPDVEKTLKKLTAQDKFELYMFSNGSHVNIQSAQSTHHILSIVFPKDKVVSVDDVRAYKPSRTAYNHLLKSVDKLSRPQDVVLISCNPFDICGARSMGMRSLWINRTIAGWVDAMGEGPTWTFKSFAELADFDPKHVD